MRLGATILITAWAGCQLLIGHSPSGPAPDARASDAREPDAGGDARGNADAGSLCGVGKVACGGLCLAATDCSGCAQKLLCKASRSCVATCASCASAPVECVACTIESQENPIGTCEPASATSYCLSGDYSKAYIGGPGERCNCNNSKVSDCVGSQHVCINVGSTDWCVTCGEAGQKTDNLPCKGGGTCDTSLSPPRCR